MRAGSLDALAVAAGVPVPSFSELERGQKVPYVALAQDQMVALRLAMPELASSVVAAGTYPSLLRHYQTVGMFNFAVARASLPSDLIYAIVDAVFANHEELMGIHSAAAETLPANFTRNTFLPFHPGHPTGTAARPPQESCAETEGLRDAENQKAAQENTPRASSEPHRQDHHRHVPQMKLTQHGECRLTVQLPDIPVVVFEISLLVKKMLSGNSWCIRQRAW